MATDTAVAVTNGAGIRSATSRCYRQSEGYCRTCPVRAFSMCAALDDRDLHRLSDARQTQVVEAGANLFAEGDPAAALFTVVSGTIKLYKLLPDGRRQVTGFVRAGDFLGMAVHDVYAYSAEAVTAASVCRFPRHALEGLLEAFPKLQRRLFAMASNELVAAQDQMVLLGRKTAKERICTFLGNLAAQEVRRGQAGNVIALPMTRMDIADYLGLTIETVSRTISCLKTAGMISLLDGHRVRINDGLELAVCAGGSR